MLKEQLVSWENATFKESRITLQQDGNASHTANLVEEWHNKKMAIVWTKNFWPHFSPGKNPMDFTISSNPQSNVCPSYLSSVTPLKLI